MDSAAVVGVILGDGSLERLLGALARDQELNTREFLDKLSSAVSSSLSSTATRKESQGILRALGHHLSLLTEARTTSPFNARLVMFYLEMLSLLLPFTSPWPVFELHWTPLIEPLLALNGQKIVYSPNALQQGHDWLRELLLKEALMVSPNTPSITTFLLSLLHSEDENQALKQAVEDLLLDFAMTGSMTHFCACLGSLAVKAQYRLSLFVLLTRLLTREAVPVYLILESSVLPLVLESCIRDTHPLILKTSLALLTILLSSMSCQVVRHYPRLWNIYTRYACWDEMVRTGSKADQDLEEMAPLSIRSSMDYFHTLLYGMMPLHLIKSVQEIIKKKDSGFPLSSCLDFKEDNESGPLFPGFEQWVDPILSERLDKARLAVPDGTISIAESLKERLTRHKLHPALLSMTLEEELVEPWFKDMDASDLTVECMLLRSLPVSPVHETPTDELPLVAGKKQDEDGEGRDPLVENVMQTYLLLCHLDPYLKVFPYRNSNIKTNEEALLLISLNFEAALRSRYTRTIIDMKKKRLSFELAEAQVESLKEQKEELQQELAQTVQLLSEAQKITMECAIETKQSTEEHSIVLRTLQDSVSTLSTQLGTTELSLRSTQDTLKHTQNLLESESQSRLDLERQLTMAKNDLNKLDECDRVVTELTQKLKNGSLPSGVQEKDAIALLESQTKALEFELHDLELDNARLQEKAQIESSALESAKKEKQNAETHIKELTLRLAEMTTSLETKASLAAKTEAAQETKFRTIIRINRILEAQIQDLYIQLEAKDDGDAQRGMIDQE